ncbi:MAG: HK97 gp10 family phage protein [Burkholderiales bacterium]|nr:HK97 gp10 family phage protein [Burkholderiales bacterium]
MGMKIRMDVARFKEQLQASADKLHAATRPAAQAGAQVLYERALQLAPVSQAAHMFHGTHGVYGPYSPGNLRDSIYQVYSKDRSFEDVSTYHVSWNASKAPYGAMVEFGTSHAPAHSFIGRAVAETRTQVREAVKTRFLQEARSK